MNASHVAEVIRVRTKKGHDVDSEPLFQNVSESRLRAEDVFERMLRFMKQDPKSAYHFIIGTDCQAHSKSTTFVTGIILHRLGKGAWACYRKRTVPFRVESIRQKLSMETAMSEELAWMFGEDKRKAMENVVMPYLYKGASFRAFIDIDAGTDEKVSRTAPYVAEMVSRVEATGMTARVKPEAVAASSYANRHTKTAPNTKAIVV